MNYLEINLLFPLEAFGQWGIDITTWGRSQWKDVGLLLWEFLLKFV